MKYPLDKYRYYFTTTAEGSRKVIAISTYAGKTVRGVAICHPGDVYDEELGKKIAATRCAVKIAEKRKSRATSKVVQAEKLFAKARRHLHDMEQYERDAVIGFDDALGDLAVLMGTVGE